MHRLYAKREARNTIHNTEEDQDLNSLSNRPPSYCSYILRCWQESTEAGETNEIAGTAMRFSLEDPHTGERFGFGGPEALIAFLRTKMECPPETSPLPTTEEPVTR